MVEHGAGKAATQPVRAGRRHADAARRLRDAAAVEQGDQEAALPGRGPVGAIDRGGRRWLGGSGGGVLVHPTG